MSITDRCDEIIRLIDEVLDDGPSETDVHRRPAPSITRVQTAVGMPRMGSLVMPVEH